MADIRINALATTAASTASDDFVAVDGSANGTRKLNAFSPTFGGTLTASGTASVTGQINGSAGYQFRGATGVSYELLRYVGGTNNPGIFAEVNESTKKVTIIASGSLVTGQTLGLGAEGSEALTIGTANATLSGNLTVSGTGNNIFNSGGGNFLIGTAADTGQKLQVAGVVNSSGAGYTNSGYQITNTTASRTTGWFQSNSGTTILRDVTGTADLLSVDLSGNATFAGSIAIGNTVNTVSPTSPNRTITMVIGGTTYYIHAKTTND